MIDSYVIGERIKELRKERGLTQNEFAEAANVSFQAVSNWERGISTPDLENLVRISSYFGVLVDFLLREKNEELFLGIDGGGTKTEFVLVSRCGNVVKHFVKSGSNPNDIGYAKMLELISNGIEESLLEFQSIKAVFCAIAGITTGNYAKTLSVDLKKRYPQLKIQIETDCSNLFALKDGVNMAVISGTGSVVFVKSGNGYKRLGGWGYLLDTSGSAYDIGIAALRTALCEEDLQKKPSIMSKMLCEKLHSSTVWEHINIIYTKGRSYIAGLSSVVFDAYMMGDENAVQIIEDNAKGLMKLLNTGVELYGVEPIAIANGGIFEHYSDIILPYIEKYSNLKLIVSDLPPIYGACRNACRMESVDIPNEFYNNFKKTYGGMN